MTLRRKRLRTVRFAVLTIGMLLLALAATLGAAIAIISWRSEALVRRDHRRAIQAANAIASLAMDQHLQYSEHVLAHLQTDLQGTEDAGVAAVLRGQLRRSEGLVLFNVFAVKGHGDHSVAEVDGLTTLSEGFLEALSSPPTLSSGWTVYRQGGDVALVRSLPLYDKALGRQSGLLHGAVFLGGNEALLSGLRRATGAAGYAIVDGGSVLASSFEAGQEETDAAILSGGERGREYLLGGKVCGAQPFPRTGDADLRILSFEKASTLRALQMDLRKYLSILLMLATGVSVVAASLFARWVTRPVRRLMDYARQIAAGESGATLRPSRVKELDLLASILGQTMARLREREEDLATTLHSIGDGVIATDVHGSVTRMNRVAEQLTGWSMAEALGKPLEEVYAIRHGRFQESADNLAARVLRQESAVGLHPSTLVARGGEERLVGDRAAPIRAFDGSVRGVVLIFRDVTREHREQEARREAEHRLTTLSNNFAGGLVFQIVVSVETGERRFVYISESVERIHGVSAAAVLDNPRLLYDQVIEEDRNLLAEREALSLAGMSQFSAEVRCRLSSGEERWVMLTSTPRRLSGSEVIWDGIEVDVTEQKTSEQEQEKLQSQLIHSQKLESIGRLAGGVAHDFNNMLAVIMGTTEMALDSVPPDQPLHADLQEIRKAAERSANLTRQLLAFARKQTVVPKVLDLNETVEGMLKMLRRLIGEHVELDWRPGADVGRVKMDPSQIDQILVNLCVNARDAIGESGSVAIETGSSVFDADYCSRHAGAVPGHFVWLVVEDNGRGMDAETLPHIFEPFYSTKGAGMGTGLGLATVYGIVKQNSGFIGVDSAPGQGSTFTIYLPRNAETVETPAAVGAEMAPERGRETILLVEDEPAILHMVNSLLERRGYEVLSTDAPGEALRLAGERPGGIDLLLTDVVMPEMDGRELSRRILDIQPGIRCLFMSGHTADILAQRGILDAGVQFIQKPFSMRDMIAKVRETLGKL